MKFKLFLLALMAAFILPACSDEDAGNGNDVDTTMVSTGDQMDAEATIVADFERDFPDAQNVNWDHGNGRHTVEFVQDDREHTIVFLADGKVKSEHVRIESGELPPSILQWFEAEYPGIDITESDQISANGQTYYAIEFEEDGEEVEYHFDSAGNKVEWDDDEMEDAHDHGDMEDTEGNVEGVVDDIKNAGEDVKDAGEEAWDEVKENVTGHGDDD